MYKFLLDNAYIHIAHLNAKLISDKTVIHNSDEIPAQIAQSPEIPYWLVSDTAQSHLFALSLQLYCSVSEKYIA